MASPDNTDSADQLKFEVLSQYINLF